MPYLQIGAKAKAFNGILGSSACHNNFLALAVPQLLHLDAHCWLALVYFYPEKAEYLVISMSLSNDVIIRSALLLLVSLECLINP